MPEYVYYDEVDEMTPEKMAVIQDALKGSKFAMTKYKGTPKSETSMFEEAFKMAMAEHNRKNELIAKGVCVESLQARIADACQGTIGEPLTPDTLAKIKKNIMAALPRLEVTDVKPHETLRDRIVFQVGYRPEPQPMPDLRNTVKSIQSMIGTIAEKLGVPVPNLKERLGLSEQATDEAVVETAEPALLASKHTGKMTKITTVGKFEDYRDGSVSIRVAADRDAITGEPYGPNRGGDGFKNIVQAARQSGKTEAVTNSMNPEAVRRRMIETLKKDHGRPIPGFDQALSARARQMWFVNGLQLMLQGLGLPATFALENFDLNMVPVEIREAVRQLCLAGCVDQAAMEILPEPKLIEFSVMDTVVIDSFTPPPLPDDCIIKVPPIPEELMTVEGVAGVLHEMGVTPDDLVQAMVETNIGDVVRQGAYELEPTEFVEEDPITIEGTISKDKGTDGITFTPGRPFTSAEIERLKHAGCFMSPDVDIKDVFPSVPVPLGEEPEGIPLDGTPVKVMDCEIVKHEITVDPTSGLPTEHLEMRLPGQLAGTRYYQEVRGDELDRSVCTDEPVRVVDSEPDSPSISIPFQTLPATSIVAPPLTAEQRADLEQALAKSKTQTGSWQVLADTIVTSPDEDDPQPLIVDSQ